MSGIKEQRDDNAVRPRRATPCPRRARASAQAAHAARTRRIGRQPGRRRTVGAAHRASRAGRRGARPGRHRQGRRRWTRPTTSCAGRGDGAAGPRRKSCRRASRAAARASRRSRRGSPACRRSRCRPRRCRRPAAATRAMLSALMPPSTSSRMSLPLASMRLRACSILRSAESMKLWPPKPGFTLMIRTRSMSSITQSSTSSGAAGLNTRPGLAAGRLDRLDAAVHVRATHRDGS